MFVLLCVSHSWKVNKRVDLMIGSLSAPTALSELSLSCSKTHHQTADSIFSDDDTFAVEICTNYKRGRFAQD